MRFRGFDYLVKHMFDYHHTIDWLSCDMCDLKFKFLSSLGKHKSMLHGNFNNTPQTTTKILTNENDRHLKKQAPVVRTYRYRYDDGIYSLIRKPNRALISFQCNICGVSPKDYWTRHCDLHRQYRYPCRRCDKEFFCASLLSEHEIKQHFMFNRIKCVHCG